MSFKPGDHPDFFRRPPPEGESRESRIRLDREGRFWHEGTLVDRPALQAALHRWLSRHPDDGRYVLENGYDWCYLEVDDVPCFVVGIRERAGTVWLALADGSEEPLDPTTLREGPGGALYTSVKAHAPRGPFAAKLTRAAQAALAPFVVEGVDGQPCLRVGGRSYPLPSS